MVEIDQRIFDIPWTGTELLKRYESLYASGNMNDSGTLIDFILQVSKALLTQQLKYGTTGPNTQNISDCGRVTC